MSGSARSGRLGNTLDSALKAFAAALLLSLFAAALHDVSRDWDVWYYHLPFAARVAGIMGPDTLLFSHKLQAQLDGFPLLAELLQGLLWRVTGRIESANLLAFSCVPSFALFLRARLAVPPHLVCLGLLAVPLIQVHATSCYVDLPGNTAAAALLIIVLDSYSRPAPPSPVTLVCALVAAAIAANTKLLLEPLVFLALAALGARAVPALLRRRHQVRRARWTLAACCLALPIVFMNPLVNTLRYGNPVYPERVALAGLVLPGPDTPYSSSPVWLERAPRPARFVASIFELGLPPLWEPRRWTIDQFTPLDAPGYRMGGFFGVYVAAQLAALLLFARRDRSRRGRTLLIGFLAISACTAFFPQSHELRYYLFWIITLIALNLWLATRSARPQAAQRALAGISMLSLLTVLASTRAGYAYPAGSTFRELLAEKVSEPSLGSVVPGEHVCARRQPYAFLLAAPFHPPRAYRLRLSEDLRGCHGERPID